jgi:hypothetical protein
MKRATHGNASKSTGTTESEARELKAISDSVTAYYDSLSDEEMEEDRAWGEFSESQMEDWS